jgi:hypothetical protein
MSPLTLHEYEVTDELPHKGSSDMIARRPIERASAGRSALSHWTDLL